MAGARIMIVEDESIVAKDIQNSLKSLGYTVPAMVSSGEEAVHKVGETLPDLVLMDIMLKGAMDGIEAANQIRARYKIPVVYLTAYTDDETLKRAKISEAFGYLLKPFEDRELRTTIEMALYKHTMERKLRESREWLATTLRCIGDAVIATDSAGSIQFINPVAQTLTGWKQAEALQRKVTEVFCLKEETGVEPLERTIERVLHEGQTVHSGHDAQLLARDAQATAIDHGVAPIRGDAGDILGVVITFRDVTERRQAELRERTLQDRLFRSKRLESVGVLAGGVAHDLNNILGPIVGYPDLIVKRLPPDSPMREELDIIKNSARKAVDVIRDLLTLGRMGHFPAKPLAFPALVEHCLKSPAFSALQKNAPCVEVTVRQGDGLPAITGSEQHLTELVMNLMFHAVNAMPNGGTLTLATAAERLTQPAGGFETIEPGHYVVLRVSDTGAGIGEADINRIFEPFYARKRKGHAGGTGLGLAVVYGVVKEHNGFIDVLSAPQAGTTFAVYLPVSGAAIEPVKAPPVQDYRGAETILVVDDDDEQRKFATRLLRSYGYKVFSAHNGRAAISLVEVATRTPGSTIDLVLLDMIMGDEFDGLDTYQKLLELNPHQKAIIVSGFAVTERIKEALRLGVGQYLQKPYTVDELGKAIRSELDKAAASQ